MALLPVSRLLRPLTRDEVMTDLITLGDSLNLRASSWRGAARWFLIALSEIGSRSSVQIAAIAAHSYNKTAWGVGLDNISDSQFDNPRTLATRTRGTMTLSDAGSVGPVTWLAGTRTFAPQGEFAAFRFTNAEDVTVLLDEADVEFEVQAETGGAGWNDVPNDVAWDISPTYAGLDVANPSNNDGPVSNWVTQLGANKSEDQTMRASNRTKWATLGGNAPSGAYEYWVLNSTDSSGDPVGIVSAYVPEPPGDGTLVIYIATATGAPTAGQVTDVQTYIDARKSKMATPTVTAVSELTVAVTGSVTMRAGTQVDLAAIEAALNVVILSTPVGGTIDGAGGTLIWDELIASVRGLDPGIVSVKISIPSTDVPITDSEKAVPGTHSITVVEI